MLMECIGEEAYVRLRPRRERPFRGGWSVRTEAPWSSPSAAVPTRSTRHDRTVGLGMPRAPR